jgi:hypothetical protein
MHGKKSLYRQVHIGNKWWKIMTIDSKEMKTTRRRVEDAMKGNREECMLMGGKMREGMGKENPKTRWKMQRGETDRMDRRKWIGGIEREQTRGRRREMDLYR